ncbi:bifunctional hydroxymethylpyrimidine kinase/phosphomethylpyrimidine kinase [Enterococcus hermanniensis]|uniref:pyridoxal kinase n=1 Tax=Enterococcus hermanniensis TaxID=249189 RepID=A0A1L8TQH8_9ENTE|nr:bifunctional hydroxymethylpyrimidine kinase/phosphomethylpyrimidine kinase [Enterococcus hermanniensis]OJG46438.1 phosphomethylpyrimidine kinase [Enterococcus hermanniensis]
MTKTILTIAGSDTLAGGGLQSDLKTFENHHLFGTTAITCIAICKDDQFEINDIPPLLLADQLQTLSDNLSLDGIKIGLIHHVESVAFVEAFIKSFNGPVVLDPVMAFKETNTVYSKDYREKLIKLFPFTTIITPNLKEAELLSEHFIHDKKDMELAARKIIELGAKTVVIKGGERLSGDLATDLFYDGHRFTYFTKPKLAANTINGAGCSFASAIASNLVLGNSLLLSVEKSKEFVYQAIENGLELKNGEGNVWFGKNL